jgi:hypothetical protein
VPKINAAINPAPVARPILIPPSSNASGIIDSASMTKIAPEAKDKAIDIISLLAFANTEKPMAEETVPMAATTSHKSIIFVFLFQLFFMP